MVMTICSETLKLIYNAGAVVRGATVVGSTTFSIKRIGTNLEMHVLAKARLYGLTTNKVTQGLMMDAMG